MYKKVRKRKEMNRRLLIEKAEGDERKSDNALCSTSGNILVLQLMLQLM